MSTPEVQVVETASPPQLGFYSAEVKDKVINTHRVYWTITNDTKLTVKDLLNLVPRSERDSGQFAGIQVFCAEGQKWRLKLHNFYTYDHNYRGSVTIQVVSSELKELWIASKVTVFAGDPDVNGTILGTSEVTVGDIKANERRSNSFTLDVRFGPNVYETDKLTVVVEISFIKGAGDTWHKITVPSSTALAESLGSTGAVRATSVPFMSLEKSAAAPISDDVEVCKFQAHKFILAARSPVFAAMFEHTEMKENTENEVKIEDIKPYVLEEMLTFIYTGNAPNLERMAAQLLYAAEKYQLKRLKALCERELAVTTMVGNAAERLVLAHQHEAHQLKKAVLDFIAVNGRTVMKSDGWESVKAFGAELLTEVLDAIYNSPEVGPPTKKQKT